MTDTDLLNKKISDSGLKKNYISKRLNLTPYGLKLKIDNINEFKASEISALCEVLNITSAKEKESIFFGKKED